jgi:hypothetical protein
MRNTTLAVSALSMVVGAIVGMAGAGAQTNHVASQRRVIALNPQAPNRLNSPYVAVFFLGGATGSALAAPLELTNWHLPALVGAMTAIAALVLLVGGRSQSGFLLTNTHHISNP